MAITKSNAAKQAATDAVVDLVDGGAGAGKLVIKDGSTTLSTHTMSDPAFGDSATSGTATASAIGDATASATGTADNFDITDSDDTVVFSGSVTATSGGGDLELDNTSITSGQTVAISSFTYNDG